MSMIPGSVDLSNYTDNLLREIQDPNDASSYNLLNADSLTGHLADAFWEARLDGLLEGYTCDDNGIIYPVGTVVSVSASAAGLGPDSPAQPYTDDTMMNWSADGQLREMVQLVILYASFRLLRNTLRGMRTAFSTSAGPVRYEYQQSATMLTAIMQDVVNRRNMILARLSDLGTTQVTMIDSIMARDESLMNLDTYWVSGGNNYPSAYEGSGY